MSTGTARVFSDDTAKGTVAIWTDGACSGNPGPGGWGAILRYAGTEKELSGGDAPPPITAWS